MKNVIHVLRSFSEAHWGGGQTMVLNCCRALKDLGCPTQIFTNNQFCEASQESMCGVPVRRFRYFYPFLRLSEAQKRELDAKAGPSYSLPLLLALLREKDLYLIHTHGPWVHGTLVRLASSLRRIPYIVSSYAMYYANYEPETAHMKATTRGVISYKRALDPLLKGGFEVVRDSAAVITDNTWEYDKLRQDFPGKPVHLLRGCLFPEDFPEADGAIFRTAYSLRDYPVVLSVARIDRQKNQIAIVKAFEEVVTKHPDTYLVLIGHVADSAYHQRLMDAMASTSCKDRILVIPGLEPRSEMIRAAYAASDVCVMADVYGGPNMALLEMWAYGKAVISARTHGEGDLLRDGIDGVYFDTEDHHDLAEKIGFLISNRAISETIGLNAKRRVESEFSPTNFRNALSQIYGQVL